MIKNQKTVLKLSLAYSLILSCTLFAGGFFSLYSEKDALDSELSSRLAIIAGLAVRDISTIIKSKRLDIHEWTSIRHKVLSAKIRSIQEVSGFEKIVLIGRGYKVIVDSGKNLPIGADYPFLNIDDSDLKRIWTGESLSSVFYTGRDGKYYKSAYAPIKDGKGEVIMVVMVEASVEFFEIMQSVKRQLILLGIVMLVATILISLWISKSIINPLKVLINGFEEVEKKGFPRIEIKGNNEFSYLGDKFNNMVESIREKDRIIRLKYDEEYKRAERIKGLSDYILEGIPTGVICIRTNRKIRIINKAGIDILRINTPWIEKECETVLGRFPKISSMLLDSLAADRQEGFVEIHVETEDESRYLAISASSIHGKNRELLGSIAIFSDLSELKQLQNQVKLQERLAAIGELSAGIAHEIRNPLGAIQGFIELLGMEKDTSKTKKLTSEIIFEIKNLNRRISEFLEFARQPVYDFRISDDIKNLVETSVAYSILSEDADNYNVYMDFDEILPKLNIDSMYIESAFINILKNARESMPGGGDIHIAIKRENSHIKINISDNGSGIPQEDMNRIFDPFYTTKQNGTGLGLAIAHKTIESHGGTLFVKKSNKEGTAFQIKLPIFEQQV